MYVDVQTVITAGSALAAASTILTFVLKVHKWYLRQEQQDRELKRIKDENMLICEALAACLNGLNQLGANGPVTKAREKLENYLNMEAHK